MSRSRGRSTLQSVAYNSDAGYTQCTKDVYTFLKEAKVITAQIGTTLPWDFSSGAKRGSAFGNADNGKSYTIRSLENTNWVTLGASRNEIAVTFQANGQQGSGTGSAVPNNVGLQQAPSMFYLHGEIHYASGARGVSLMFTQPVQCVDEDGREDGATCKTYAWLNSKDSYMFYPDKLSDYSRLQFKQPVDPEDAQNTQKHRILRTGKKNDDSAYADTDTTGTNWHTIGLADGTAPKKDVAFTRNNAPNPVNWHHGTPRAYQRFDDIGTGAPASNKMSDGTTKSTTTAGGFGSFAPRSGVSTI